LTTRKTIECRTKLVVRDEPTENKPTNAGHGAAQQDVTVTNHKNKPKHLLSPATKQTKTPNSAVGGSSRLRASCSADV
jgi:hypothetical protein